MAENPYEFSMVKIGEKKQCGWEISNKWSSWWWFNCLFEGGGWNWVNMINTTNFKWLFSWKVWRDDAWTVLPEAGGSGLTTNHKKNKQTYIFMQLLNNHW